MQWRWAWINLVILWSSDRGKPNRLKETNRTHRRSRGETGGSILRAKDAFLHECQGESVLGSRPESDTFRETTKFAEDVRTRLGLPALLRRAQILRSESQTAIQTETVLRSSSE